MIRIRNTKIFKIFSTVYLLKIILNVLKRSEKTDIDKNVLLICTKHRRANYLLRLHCSYKYKQICLDTCTAMALCDWMVFGKLLCNEKSNREWK